MKKRFVSILLMVVLLLGSTIAYADIGKDETVYVMLENDGKVSNIKVVNHVYGNGDEETYIDYGEYKNLVNLIDDREPRVSGDRIEWNASHIRDGDLYYEGEVEKKLPLEIDIKYYLDGQRIEPEKLSGQDGRLKIEIALKFGKETEKYNMMAQVQVPMDLDIFTNIESQGSRVVVGKVATISFVAMSPGQEIFTLEAEGKDISLEPMTITLTPSDSLIPEDIGGELQSFTQGLEEIDNGMSKLGSGLDESIDGTNTLKLGTDRLGQGLDELHSAASKIDSQTAKISGGLDAFQGGLEKLVDSIQSSGTGELIGGMNKLYNGLDELSRNGKQIHKGIESTHTGLQRVSDGMTVGIADLVDGLERYEAGHQELVVLAENLAKLLEASPDPQIKKMADALAGGMHKEAEAIADIKKGIQGFDTKLNVEGIKPVADGLGQLSENYGKYQQGIVSMRDSVGGFMGALPEDTATPSDGLDQMVQQFNTLKDGIDKTFRGYREINRGLEQIKDSAGELSGGMNNLSKGQVEIRDGMGTLRDKGIKRMKTEIEDSMGQVLGDDADRESYTSFMDNDRNENSNVQFIMRTPGVQKVETHEKVEDTPKTKKSIFQRFLDLFR